MVNNWENTVYVRSRLTISIFQEHKPKLSQKLTPLNILVQGQDREDKLSNFGLNAWDILVTNDAKITLHCVACKCVHGKIGENIWEANQMHIIKKHNQDFFGQSTRLIPQRLNRQ